ncbi:unnamed protein product [Agarophyton chilense]
MLFSALLLSFAFALSLACRASLAADTADIVIAGAGTAGCPLAARLCVALPHKRITLLERAAPRSKQAEFIVRAPRLLFSTWTSPELLETFPSLVNPALNRSHDVLTGRTLGGTSAITGMQWSVPLNGSIESWGVRGLDTASAAFYFQRAYRQLSVAPSRQRLRYAQAYVDAAQRAGFHLSQHHLDGVFRSVWHNHLTIDRNLRRTDACSAYVQPLLTGVCRHNLRLVQNITVTAVKLNRRRGGVLRATGVKALQTQPDNSTVKRFFVASDETILSAGPYGSAKILQLSGIGLRRVLRAAGVPLRLSLPVGERTLCSSSIGVSSVYTGVPNEPVNNFSLVNDERQRQLWEQGQTSVLGTAVSAANGRVGTDGYFGSSFVPFWPDVPEVYSYCHLNSQSRGFLRIRDADPFSPPTVQNNIMGNRGEYARIVRCLQSLVAIHNQFPPHFNMSFTNPERGEITEDWVRRTLNTGAHFVGACPVGDVLDDRLRVRGVQSLRVIDSSSLRDLPTSAGPMASVVMLAEFMSDLISKLYRD